MGNSDGGFLMDAATQNLFYSLFLTLHNLTRWLVVIFALLAIARAFQGWIRKQEWGKSDDRAGILFTSMVDMQVLWGLVLYFLFSPISPQLVANFGEAMKSPFIRYFGLEHVVIMLVGLILAHVGRAISRKAKDAVGKHRAAAIGYTFSILVILSAIPWPFLSNARPWFRLFGLTF
jgi:hypothetical protein